MVHWVFLILASIGGFVAGYAFLYYMAGVASDIISGAVEAAKTPSAGLHWLE